MIARWKYLLASLALVAATQAAAQATFFDDESFQGRSFSTQESVQNFQRLGFNDSISSVEIVGNRWEVCSDSRLGGRCVVLRPGRYPSLAAIGIDNSISSARVLGNDERVDNNRYAPLPVAVAQVVLYEREGFQGRSFTTERQIGNFDRFDFNDRASSVEVVGERWELCEDVRFGGRCVVLRPGRYASLAAMGLNDRISSVRLASSNQPAPAPVPVPIAIQATFYENENFQGRSFTTVQPIPNFDRIGFNDRASSVEIVGERWEVCEDTLFTGRCIVLRPGRYASLAAMGLNNRASSVRVATATPPAPVPGPIAAQAIFYENENFQGRSFTTQQPIPNFERFGFNDRASSADVFGERWEVCEDTSFRGRCIVLRPGRYASLAAMGLNNRASSVRSINNNTRIEDSRYAPLAQVGGRDYRRRDGERLFEAVVTSARAVVGTPDQRCWIERGQVAATERSGSANVPGAVVGGIIGGILGHQVGGGSGKDAATIAGVVGGAAIGANVGRDRVPQVSTQDVQRCENVANPARPDYWDVTYIFRGQEHRVQMSVAPGPTVTVNESGEPRG